MRVFSIHMSIFILNDLLFVSWFNEVPIFLFDSLFLYLSMFIYLPHVYIQVFIYRGISFVLISFFFFFFKPLALPKRYDWLFQWGPFLYL